MPKSYDRLGLYSNASVLKHTGKDWQKWVTLLDKFGARLWTHQEIVAFLAKKYRLTPWWQQGVTYGYEIAIGRRIEGQNLKGEYSVTATKTYPVTPAFAWKQMTSHEGLAVWLKPLSDFDFKPKSTFETHDGAFGEIRTMKMGVRVRLTWHDTDWEKPSVIQMMVVARPKNKCIVVISQEKLVSARIREQMRERWKSALTDLQDLLLAKSGTKV